MSELFTQGSVGGAAGNCCLYPATRIAKLRLIENGCACGVTLASKVILLARNRVNFGVSWLGDFSVLVQPLCQFYVMVLKNTQR